MAILLCVYSDFFRFAAPSVCDILNPPDHGCNQKAYKDCTACKGKSCSYGKEFLSDTGIAEEVIDRVAFLVGHHHTFSGIDGIDYQILIEADYIANATENGYGQENIVNFMQKIMKTEGGKQILKAIYPQYLM